ncbi:hypothetical protein ACFL4C_03335 [Candidatus Omnitrophota bacterium]
MLVGKIVWDDHPYFYILPLLRLFINLTPSVPLSFKGEGEVVLKGLHTFILPCLSSN